MQLILTFTAPRTDGFQAEWETGAEGRSRAGLTQLQLWREADTGAPVALFEVNDRDKAQAWIDKERGLGSRIEARFLQTA